MSKELRTAKISVIALESLRQLRNQETFVQLNIQDMDHYTTLKTMAEDGYLEKNSKEFKITESGLALLDDVDHYIEDEKIDLDEGTVIDLNKMGQLKEEKEQRDVVKIDYMRKHPTENLIESHVAIFEKDMDGTPIIPVSEESYAGLLQRNPGEHWRKYVGEAGRKMIREKKLSRVYIQNEDTGRKYLYIVPKK